MAQLPTTRIWIESKPFDYAPLIILHQKIQYLQPEFKPYPLEHLHLTLLHIGIPAELFQEIHQHNSNLTREIFDKNLEETLTKIKNFEISPFTLQGNELKLFGSDSRPLLVLTMVTSPELKKEREQYLNLQESFLEKCGITKDNVEEVVSKSRNLKNNSEQNYTPHITLGWYPSSNPLPQIQAHDIAISFTKPELTHR